MKLISVNGLFYPAEGTAWGPSVEPPPEFLSAIHRSNLVRRLASIGEEPLATLPTQTLETIAKALPDPEGA